MPSLARVVRDHLPAIILAPEYQRRHSAGIIGSFPADGKLADQERMIRRLSEAFELRRSQPEFHTVTRRMGNRYKPAVADRAPAPEALSEANAQFMQEALDLGQEHAMGYDTS